MSAENDAGAGRHFVEFIDKYDSFLMKLVDDILVVDDFAPDIDWLAIGFEGKVDDIDCPNYARAESSRRCQDYFLFPLLFMMSTAGYRMWNAGCNGFPRSVSLRISLQISLHP